MGGWTAGTILQVPGAHTNERLSERRANDVRLGEPHKGMRRTTSFSALSVRRVVSAPSPAATRLLTGVEC